MYEYFYNFYKRRLAQGLFNTDQQDGTPSPPASQERIDEESVERIDEPGVMRITQ